MVARREHPSGNEVFYQLHTEKMSIPRLTMQPDRPSVEIFQKSTRSGANTPQKPQERRRTSL
jgi:hypothetical protein